MTNKNIQMIIDLEQSLNKIKIILQLSKEEILKLQYDAFSIANQRGCSCSNILSTLSESAQNGGREELEKTIKRLKS